MITYQYKARDKSGKLVTGVVEAVSESALVNQLEQKEYITLQITPVKSKTKTGAIPSQIKKSRVKFSKVKFESFQKDKTLKHLILKKRTIFFDQNKIIFVFI